MNSQFRIISPILLLALAFAIWLPNQVTAADLQEAKVTQVVQDVKVVPSGAAARPATVNETVRQGNAVQTGTQSRSELTFRDQTITRLGEKTIYNVGGGRTIELGSGQFLLYVPKNSGGAKVKMGPVTAAITGTTVVGNVLPSGVVEFTVLEGTARVHLDSVGQCSLIVAGQKVVYDPIAMRLEDPVEVDIQQQLTSPLVTDFRQLPSKSYINVAIQNQHRAAARLGAAELAHALAVVGASSSQMASPEQFMQAFRAVLVRYPQNEISDLVATAVRARPDLADKIVVAAVTGRQKGKEMPCDWVQGIVDAAIAASPRMANEIINALLQAAPMLRACVGEPCFPANEFASPQVISPINPANTIPEGSFLPNNPHHHVVRSGAQAKIAPSAIALASSSEKPFRLWQRLLIQTQISPGSVPQRKQYLEDGRGVAVQTLWDDLVALSPSSKERLGYATQKPEALLETNTERVVQRKDLVVDCFVGSGTTAAVACVAFSGILAHSRFARV